MAMGRSWKLRVGSREREVKARETQKAKAWEWNGIICLVGKLFPVLWSLGNQVPEPRRGPEMKED